MTWPSASFFFDRILFSDVSSDAARTYNLRIFSFLLFILLKHTYRTIKIPIGIGLVEEVHMNSIFRGGNRMAKKKATKKKAKKKK